MGHVFQKAKVQSTGDLIAVKAGQLRVDQVRELEVNFLVDTGATMICLPADMIKQLGLYPWDEKVVETGDGPKEKRIFSPIELHLLDRSDNFNVMELPSGTIPLLGVVPLQALDLHINFKKGLLEGNPRHGGKRVLYLF